MTQNEADALGTLLGWEGAARQTMPIAARDAIMAKFATEGVVDWDSVDGEWYVIDPAETAQRITDGMAAGELAR